jgi:uncharacterized membrane protein (UPF0127 family)
MKLAAAIAAGTLLMVGGSADAGRATQVTLQGALTSERISGFGTMTPARDGGRARLTLQRESDAGWAKVASKWIRLRGASDSDGDGRRDSTFSASFPSPAEGSCRLKVRVPRTERYEAARVSYRMPCARPDFPTGTATLIPLSPVSPQTEIAVEIADTDPLRQFGLMFKRRLAAERGTAFEFEQPTSGGFWMKNTLIPLSIAFYSTDGTIVAIMDMEPCEPEASEADQCPTYDPQTTYQGALEVNLGAFERWGIAEGDRIVVTRS